MNRKKAILIITIPLVVGMVIIGTTLFSLIQANAQGASTGKNLQPTEIKADKLDLTTTLTLAKDPGNVPTLSPNAFFDVQH